MPADAAPVPRAVVVDLDSPVPPYEQIRSQVASLIATGELQPGERLPLARALAADLGVANGTVNRAYKELYAAGLIEARRRHGTVVRGPANPGAAVPGPAVNEALDRLVEAVRAAGLSDDDVTEMVRGRLRQATAQQPVPPPEGAEDEPA